MGLNLLTKLTLNWLPPSLKRDLKSTDELRVRREEDQQSATEVSNPLKELRSLIVYLTVMNMTQGKRDMKTEENSGSNHNLNRAKTRLSIYK